MIWALRLPKAEIATRIVITTPAQDATALLAKVTAIALEAIISVGVRTAK